MKILDANVLLYAVNESAPHHRKAKAWLDAALSGSEPIGFEWTVLVAFLRVSTRLSIFPDPLRLEDAFALIELWLSQPCASVVHPTERHSAVLRDLLHPLGTAGNLTADAHLAAVALEHGAEVCSFDSDFARFAGVRWTNPLA